MNEKERERLKYEHKKKLFFCIKTYNESEDKSNIDITDLAAIGKVLLLNQNIMDNNNSITKQLSEIAEQLKKVYPEKFKLFINNDNANIRKAGLFTSDIKSILSSIDISSDYGNDYQESQDENTIVENHKKGFNSLKSNDANPNKNTIEELLTSFMALITDSTSLTSDQNEIINKILKLKEKDSKYRKMKDGTSKASQLNTISTSGKNAINIQEEKNNKAIVATINFNRSYERELKIAEQNLIISMPIYYNSDKRSKATVAIKTAINGVIVHKHIKKEHDLKLKYQPDITAAIEQRRKQLENSTSINHNDKEVHISQEIPPAKEIELKTLESSNDNITQTRYEKWNDTEIEESLLEAFQSNTIRTVSRLVYLTGLNCDFKKEKILYITAQLNIETHTVFNIIDTFNQWRNDPEKLLLLEKEYETNYIDNNDTIIQKSNTLQLADTQDDVKVKLEKNKIIFIDQLPFDYNIDQTKHLHDTKLDALVVDEKYSYEQLLIHIIKLANTIKKDTFLYDEIRNIICEILPSIESDVNRIVKSLTTNHDLRQLESNEYIIDKQFVNALEKIELVYKRKPNNSGFLNEEYLEIESELNYLFPSSSIEITFEALNNFASNSSELFLWNKNDYYIHKTHIEKLLNDRNISQEIDKELSSKQSYNLKQYFIYNSPKLISYGIISQESLCTIMDYNYPNKYKLTNELEPKTDKNIMEFLSLLITSNSYNNTDDLYSELNAILEDDIFKDISNSSREIRQTKIIFKAPVDSIMSEYIGKSGYLKAVKVTESSPIYQNKFLEIAAVTSENNILNEDQAREILSLNVMKKIDVSINKIYIETLNKHINNTYARRLDNEQKNIDIQYRILDKWKKDKNQSLTTDSERVRERILNLSSREPENTLALKELNAQRIVLQNKIWTEKPKITQRFNEAKSKLDIATKLTITTDELFTIQWEII